MVLKAVRYNAVNQADGVYEESQRANNRALKDVNIGKDSQRKLLHMETLKRDVTRHATGHV